MPDGQQLLAVATPGSVELDYGGVVGSVDNFVEVQGRELVDVWVGGVDIC